MRFFYGKLGPDHKKYIFKITCQLGEFVVLHMGETINVLDNTLDVARHFVDVNNACNLFFY